MKKRSACMATALLSMLGILGACSGGGQMQLVNTQCFDAAEIDRLQVDYGADDVTIRGGDAGQIVVKEYMNQDRKSYYARIEKKGGTLTIGEGKRPSGGRLDCYVELYLPAGFTAETSVHTTSGALKNADALRMDHLHADSTSGEINLNGVYTGTLRATSTSGTIRLSAIEAEKIALTTTSGHTQADSLTGRVVYQTTSGSLALTGAQGQGTFHASGGEAEIALEFTRMDGDVTAFSKNGDVRVKLPMEKAFRLEAESKEGAVQVSLPGVEEREQHAVYTTIGNDPDISVRVESRNGDIEIARR